MTPPVSPCGPLCGPMTGGAESLPLLAGSGRCGPVVGGVAAQGFRRTEGRKEKQDKNRGHRWLFRPVTSPRSAGRFKKSRGYLKWGQKQPAGITFVVTIPELLLP